MKVKLSRGALIAIGVTLLAFGGLFAFIRLHIPGEAVFLEEVRAAEAKYGKDASEVGIPLSQLAMVYMVTGHKDKAVATWERIARNDIKNFGEYSPQAAGGLRLLARVYDETGRYGDADTAYARIHRIEQRLIAMPAKAGTPPYPKRIMDEARRAMEIFEMNGDADAAARFRNRLRLMKQADKQGTTGQCVRC